MTLIYFLLNFNIYMVYNVSGLSYYNMVLGLFKYLDKELKT